MWRRGWHCMRYDIQYMVKGIGPLICTHTPTHMHAYTPTPTSHVPHKPETHNARIAISMIARWLMIIYGTLGWSLR